MVAGHGIGYDGMQNDIYGTFVGLLSGRIIIKKIRRSTNDKVIAGLCGGVGEMLSVDPVLVRLICVFLCVATAVLPLLVTYIVAWIIVPQDTSADSSEC